MLAVGPAAEEAVEEYLGRANSQLATVTVNVWDPVSIETSQGCR